jgi:hypothetical protein
MPTFETDIAGSQSDPHGLREDPWKLPPGDESFSASASRVRTPTSGSASSISRFPLGSDAPFHAAASAAPLSVPPPRYGTLKVVAMAAGSAFVVSGVLFAIFRGAPPPAPAGSIAPAMGIGASAPPAHDELDLVDLVVRVTPPSAQISIDGAAVSTNPFHARYRKDRQIHHILAAADGYDSKLEDVIFAGDVAVDVSLDRRAAPPPPVRKAPAPPPPAPPPAHSAKHPAPSASDAPSPPPSATVSASPEVSPAGGHAPLRPIVTASPYGQP